MTGQPGFFWDGYLHWARATESAESADTARVNDSTQLKLFEPIFIRLNLAFDEVVFGQIRGLLVEVQGQDSETREATIFGPAGLGFLSGFAFDIIELIIGFEHALATGQPPEFFIYRRVALTPTKHEEGSYTVIDVGAPALVMRRTDSVFVSTPPGLRASKVIAAVIDNDIGFLNTRFRAQDGTTRFAAIWLQARERLVPSRFPPFKTIHIGQVLTADKINPLLERDERQVYGELNDALHSREPFKRPPPIAAHGSMVADLAFGAEDGDAMQNVPLLGVQLPPEAAQDTSGTMSESYIVQGVRWICYWARQINPNLPVVVNVSYGVLAGQKDGGKFIEAQTALEIELAKSYGQEVTIVYAFGNGANKRQVAELTVPSGGTEKLVLEVPPDSSAPSFVELRSRGRGRLEVLPGTVEIALTHPSESKPVVKGSADVGVTEADPPVYESSGVTPTRLYNVPARSFPDGLKRPETPGYSTLAIGPTRARSKSLPEASPGDWTISITNRGADPIDVILQIQRGDTAPGYRIGGRQAQFKGALVPTVECGYATQTPVLPLTNQGTNSAFANSAHAGIVTAGALKRMFGNDVRAAYSGLGADWTTADRPDQYRVVDTAFSFGRRTSGAYSGTRARLSGTSAAAAIISRARVEARL